MLRRLLNRVLNWPRLDTALLAVGIAVLAASAARYIAPVRRAGHATLPAPAPAATPVADALPHLPAEALMAAVIIDPFRPDRSAPGRRYRLAQSDEPPLAGPQPRRDVVVPGYRVLGIAAAGEVRLALIDGSPGRKGLHIYSLGDTLDRFTLTHIAGDSVLLTSADTTVLVRIARPWASSSDRRVR